MYLKTGITICIFIMFISNALAISVGTAPGAYDIGDVKPGKDYAFKFYLITNSESDLLVSASYINVHQDMYGRNQTGRYNFIPSEASQEDIASWIEIPRNQILLSPKRVRIIQLWGGGVVRANEEVNMILRVPENAEPGYHAGAVNIVPQVVASVQGTGVSTIGVTRFIYVFKVVGNPVREGRIMAIVADRIAEDEAIFNILFKNTGTVTIDAKMDELKLYNNFGNFTARLNAGPKRIKPDEISVFSAYWKGKDVKPGMYRAEAIVSYITDHTEMESDVDIPAVIRVEKKQEVTKGGGFPWLNLLFLIIIIALIIYWFKG